MLIIYMQIYFMQRVSRAWFTCLCSMYRLKIHRQLVFLCYIFYHIIFLLRRKIHCNLDVYFIFITISMYQLFEMKSKLYILNLAKTHISRQMNCLIDNSNLFLCNYKVFRFCNIRRDVINIYMTVYFHRMPRWISVYYEITHTVEHRGTPAISRWGDEQPWCVLYLVA